MRQEVAVVHEYIRDIDNSVLSRGTHVILPRRNPFELRRESASNKNVSGIQPIETCLERLDVKIVEV